MENTKDLYELDVALFGEDMALGMWDLRWHKKERRIIGWGRCSGDYNPSKCGHLAKFRRREDAPSVWCKAPDWAECVFRSNLTKTFCWSEKVGIGAKYSAVSDGVGSTLSERDLECIMVICTRKIDAVKESGFQFWPGGVATIYRAPELFPDSALLLNEPELVVWRDREGKLHHEPAFMVLVNPSRDELAAAHLTKLANGERVTAGHIAELRKLGFID